MVRRFLKVFAIGVAIAVVLVGAALLALLSGGVQRSLALRVLPEGSELAEIRLRLSRAEISGLSLPIEGGGRLSFDRARARFDALGYYRTGLLVVEELRLEGLAIRLPDELTPEDPAPEADIEAQIRDLRRQLETAEPNLVLGTVAIDGRLESSAFGAYRFTVSGGGLSPGEEGVFDFEMAQTRPPAELGTELPNWQAMGELGVRQLMDGRLASVSARFEAVARQEGATSALAEADGEASLKTGAEDGDFRFETEAQLRVFQPSALYEPLAGMGRLDGSLSLTVEDVEGHLAVTRAQARYQDAGRDVLSVDLLQPTRLSAQQELRGELLEAKIDAFPLSLLRPFAPEGIDFEGGPVTLSATLSVEEGGRYGFVAEEIDIGATSFAIDGAPVARDLAAVGSLSGWLHPDGHFSIDVERLDLLAGGRSLARLRGTASGDHSLEEVEAEAEAWADLAELAGQPILAGLLPAEFASGVAKGTFAATGLAKTVRAEADVSDLLLLGEEDAPQRVARIAFEADETAENRWKVSADTSFGKDGQNDRNDLQYTGEFALGERVELTGSISSQRLSLADLEEVLALLPEAEAASPDQPDAEAAPLEDVPLWSGVDSRLSVRLERVILLDGVEAAQVDADIEIGEPAVLLRRFIAQFGDGQITGSSAARFDPESRRYTVEANFSAEGVDMASLLGPESRFKGRVGSEIDLQGSGTTIEEAFDRAAGRIQAQGSDGLITALNLESPAGRAVSLGAALLGGSADRYGIREFAAVLPYLNQISYQNFDVDLRRSPDGSFQLDSFELVGADLFLDGAGSIGSGSWGEILSQAMNIQLRLGARGQLATYLDRLGVLGETETEEGFRLTDARLALGGTVGEPDARSIRDYLWKAATSLAVRRLSNPEESQAQDRPVNQDEGDTPPPQEATPQDSDTDLEEAARLLREVLER